MMDENIDENYVRMKEMDYRLARLEYEMQGLREEVRQFMHMATAVNEVLDDPVEVVNSFMRSMMPTAQAQAEGMLGAFEEVLTAFHQEDIKRDFNAYPPDPLARARVEEEE